MDRLRETLALVLAVSIAASGCLAAPTATTPATGSGTGTEQRSIDVRNGDLPVDADLAYRRVTDLLDRSVDPPLAVQVVDPQAVGLAEAANETPTIQQVRPFWAAMGVTRKPGGSLNLSAVENGLTNGFGGITIFTGDGDPDVLHYVLVHEFVHYVQFRSGDARTLGDGLRAWTTDGSFVFRAILEGVAVYATDEYVRRYLDTDERNADLYEEIGARLPSGGLRQYGNSQYRFGTRYVSNVLSSPANATTLYRTPPTTSEQVIHGYAPGTEPPVDLSVEVESGEWRRVGTDRLGEAFLRVALRNGLDGARADRAAEGWGNDALVTLVDPERPSERSYVWALRWDRPTDATEFVRSIRRSLAARSNATGDIWRVDERVVTVERVGRTTTAVFVGDREFAVAANATVSSGAVVVELFPPPTGDRTDTR